MIACLDNDNDNENIFLAMNFMKDMFDIFFINSIHLT